MADFPDMLHAVRDGRRLPSASIRSLVEGVAGGTVTDAQVGAFTMAVCLRGMRSGEQLDLTLAMRDSGQVLSWPDLDGPVLDKHSTGGVGDLVSLVLGPLLAACGAYVPMISGRGLGHTGGTLDKLESVPGLKVSLDPDALRRAVREAGVAIVGQTGDLASADRRMYAIRDETSTVRSVPLIVASILSKKLAEGLDGLVLDVKTGNGAFMEDLPQARRLAAELAETSAGAGLPCSALITDMNQPLARSAGNGLELREAVACLTGAAQSRRLLEVTLALGAAALRRGGLAETEAAANERLVRALESGAAADRFARMVAAQGGPSDMLERTDAYLQSAPVRHRLRATARGCVTAMDTRSIGMAVLRLGGGRRRLTDKIDHRVGLSGLCRVGQALEKGETMATIHARSEADSERVASLLESAIAIGPDAPPPTPLVLEQIDEEA